MCEYASEWMRQTANRSRLGWWCWITPRGTTSQRIAIDGLGGCLVAVVDDAMARDADFVLLCYLGQFGVPHQCLQQCFECLILAHGLLPW